MIDVSILLLWSVSDRASYFARRSLEFPVC